MAARKAQTSVTEKVDPKVSKRAPRITTQYERDLLKKIRQLELEAKERHVEYEVLQESFQEVCESVLKARINFNAEQAEWERLLQIERNKNRTLHMTVENLLRSNEEMAEFIRASMISRIAAASELRTMLKKDPLPYSIAHEHGKQAFRDQYLTPQASGPQIHTTANTLSGSAGNFQYTPAPGE